ncbi:MAG: SDR family NAD(P)-dependent oxidoreductase [Pseudomonadota bacterium]
MASHRMPLLSRWRRVLGCMLNQQQRTARCPDSPALDGQLVLLTGGTGGIGKATARGLLERGAELILPCRNPTRAQALVADLGAAAERVWPIPLELDDLDSVAGCIAAIADRFGNRCIDILIENAGVWPQSYALTAQGHEIAFGTNVLGHFALRRALQRAALLSPSARVICVTGDIYILEHECSPAFRWRGATGGLKAYCRSKLGNLWIAAELQRRFPELTVASVHPGVVASDLAGPSSGVSGWFKTQLMIDTTTGAQTSLRCATQPDIEGDGYYHNVRGRVLLTPDDPAADRTAAARLWDSCEALANGS